MFKAWIYRLGSNPKQSVKRFGLGMLLFMLAMVAIALGYWQHYAWQMLGLAILPFALWFSGWGYLGIFANRFAQFLNNPHRKP